MDSADRSTQKDTSSSAVTSSLSDLIARLEKATGPDRELDAEILKATDPDVVGTYQGLPGYATKITFYEGATQARTIDIPCFTSSIDAAMTLVPEVGSVVLNCFDVCTSPRVQKAHAHVSSIRVNGAWHPGCLGDAASPALALCIAALKARSLPAI